MVYTVLLKEYVLELLVGIENGEFVEVLVCVGE